MSSLVLVAYPKELTNKDFIVNKISNITKNLGEFSFYVFSDPNGFIKQNWSHLDNKYTKKNDRAYARMAAEHASHAIIFWDGFEFGDLIFFVKKKNIASRIFLLDVTKVANKDKGDYFDVYIGRGTPWGNPYPIIPGIDDRDSVIKKYKEYFYSKIENDTDFKEKINSLRGKILGCHCKPLPCHGDVIADYLNSMSHYSKSHDWNDSQQVTQVSHSK